MKPFQSTHGKTYLEHVLELSARVESLEHLSNQQDILLMSLLSGTNQSAELKHSIKNIIERLNTELERNF